MIKIIIFSIALIFIGCNLNLKRSSISKDDLFEFCNRGIVMWEYNNIAMIALDSNSKVIPCSE